MSNEYVSFRPDVTVIYNHDEGSFRLVIDWDDAYQGPYDEDDDGRTEIGEAAEDWLGGLMENYPILRGTSPLPVNPFLADASAAPVKPPQPFLTCKHFCPSSEQSELAGPKSFEFDQRFPFPNCSNRAIMPNGFGPCRSYGRNMPSCLEYQAEEPVPITLITKPDGTQTLVSTARIALGLPAVIVSDPAEEGVFSRYEGTVEEAVAEHVDQGGVASDPPTAPKPPSFLATLVGAGHAQR